MSDELAVTQGKAMREMREAGVVLPFPSGNNYRVRLVGAARLLRRGSLPNVLLSFAIDAIYNGVSVEKLDAFLTLQDKEENVLEFMKSLRIICEEMFMDPLVVENPTADNEVFIDDIAPIDQGWAFKLAFAPAEALRPFRAESESDVVSVPELESVSEAA